MTLYFAAQHKTCIIEMILVMDKSNHERKEHITVAMLIESKMKKKRK